MSGSTPDVSRQVRTRVFSGLAGVYEVDWEHVREGARRTAERVDARSGDLIELVRRHVGSGLAGAVGLITGFIGAIREQSAPVLVYSVDGQRVIQGSVITPPSMGSGSSRSMRRGSEMPAAYSTQASTWAGSSEKLAQT